MAKTKLLHMKLNSENVGNFFGRDKSGVVAMRDSKEKKSDKKYGTFKGFIKGKFFNVILPLERKENKDGKEYWTGSNKGFSFTFYADSERVMHVNLYTSLASATGRYQKRSYVQGNRRMTESRTRYGYSGRSF